MNERQSKSFGYAVIATSLLWIAARVIWACVSCYRASSRRRNQVRRQSLDSGIVSVASMHDPDSDFAPDPDPDPAPAFTLNEENNLEKVLVPSATPLYKTRCECSQAQASYGTFLNEVPAVVPAGGVRNV